MRVLSFTFGNVHSDWEDIYELLDKNDIQYERIFIESFNSASFNWADVAAIDLRNCRGWQARWAEFSEFLGKLETATEDKNIKFINPPSTFRWVLNKTKYLKELEAKGVRIIPTRVIHQDVSSSLTSYMSEENNSYVVIKPDMGARAKDIKFVRQLSDGDYQIVTPGHEGNSYLNLSKAEIEVFFSEYREKAAPYPVIVQDYIAEGKEVSIVSLGDRFSYVETTKPEYDDALVAHDEYGGRNLPLEGEQYRLKHFARNVIKKMPSDVSKSPYLRIDTIEKDGQIYLLEIEAGTPRLFLKETEKLSAYANLFSPEKKAFRANSKLHANIGIVGMGMSGLALFNGMVKEVLEKGVSEGFIITIYETYENMGAGMPYDINLPESFLLNHELNHMGSVSLNLDSLDDEDFFNWGPG